MSHVPALPSPNEGSEVSTQFLPSQGTSESALVAAEINSRRLTLYGFAVVGLFFGGFALWSSFAPIASAVVAVGKIMVAGNRSEIQSGDGGVIRQILHRDGDKVKANEVLVRMDSTKTGSVYQALLVRSYEILALRARLQAERDGLNTIPFPPELTKNMADSDVEAAVTGQQRVFNVRRETIDNQIAILNQKIEEYNEEVIGLKEQIVAQSDQLGLLGEEAADVGQLLDKGLAAKPRLLDLKRAAANLRGSQAENEAEIARAQQSISSAKLQMLDLRNKQMDDVVSQLREVETQLSDLGERLRSAAHDLAQTEVRAPTAGVVVGSTIHTVGGVVAPGELLMEIVPDNDQLIVEAHVRPEDIEHVKEGQFASVRLVGFNRRVTPTVDGKVTYVSADSLLDRATNTSYYLAKIEVDLRAKPDTADLQLQPGMPTQVMVITGSRTLLDYILSPITDGMARAFRES